MIRLYYPAALMRAPTDPMALGEFRLLCALRTHYFVAYRAAPQRYPSAALGTLLSLADATPACLQAAVMRGTIARPAPGWAMLTTHGEHYHRLLSEASPSPYPFHIHHPSAEVTPCH